MLQVRLHPMGAAAKSGSPSAFDGNTALPMPSWLSTSGWPSPFSTVVQMNGYCCGPLKMGPVGPECPIQNFAYARRGMPGGQGGPGGCGSPGSHGAEGWTPCAVAAALDVERSAGLEQEIE